MRWLVVILALLALPALAQEPDAASGAGLAETAIVQFIRPSFDAFADMSQALEVDVDALCATPSAETLQMARDRFLGTVDTFSRVAFLPFGPLVRDNRIERLFLWPDPRGIALRQVQAVLAEQPDDAIDPRRLPGKSVALQGFGALEFVLFGTGSEELETTAGYRCQYGAAIAETIAGVAAAMAAEWADPDGISRRLVAPDPADADYRTTREVLEEFVGALSHGVEAIRDAQLLPFLGRDGAASRPRSAPLWRSNGTVVLVAGGLKGIAGFVALSGLAEVASGGAPLARAVALQAERVAGLEARIRGTIEEAIADPAQLDAYRSLVSVTQALQGLVGDHLAIALGLSVGFSPMDGD